LILSLSGLLISAFSQDTKVYDDEIGRIIKKVGQYPQRTKDLDVLKLNFDQANSIDMEKVSSLLATGQPDIWLEVYNMYKKLDNRQLLVKIIPQKSIEVAGIILVDYDRKIKESRYKACEYFYTRGQKLMQSDIPADVRQAYLDFIQVAGLGCAFSDLDKLLRKTILKGSTNMEFELNNRTGKKISSAIVNQLTSVIWEFKKAKYGQVLAPVNSDSFAFILRINLDEFLIGNDQVKEVQYQEERDVYQGDNLVDTIKCLVIETRQLKKAMLTGNLEYIDKQNGRVVNRIPLKVESVFRNAYATLQGNPDAAGEETRKLLLSKEAQYPTGEQMILDATEEFSRQAAGIILAE
jgi:hypothetical protein